MQKYTPEQDPASNAAPASATEASLSNASLSNASLSNASLPNASFGILRLFPGKPSPVVSLALAGGILAASTGAVWWQMNGPAPYPSAPTRVSDLAWWTQPVQLNPAMGLPSIVGDLKSIEIQPGGIARVWIAGSAALLAYSEDDGRSWVRLKYEGGTFTVPGATRGNLQKTARGFPSLVSTVYAGEPQEKPPQTKQSGSAAQEPIQTQQSIRMVVVPALTGYDAKTAQGVLQKSELRPGTTREQASPKKPGSIIGQDPPAGTRIEAGSRVNLMVAAPPASNPPRAVAPPQSPPKVAPASTPDLTPDLTMVRFMDQQRGAIAAGASYWTTQDGGRSWRAAGGLPVLGAAFDFVPRGSEKDLPDLGVRGWIEGPTGWAAGQSGRIFRTLDRGVSWIPVTRSAVKEEAGSSGSYWRLPPRLYYVALLLSLMFGLVSLQKPPPSGPVEESIVRVGTSDRALQPGEHDALDLGSIALGLSRFLRNESTIAPLTVAINGAWGTGKSSLMELLRADLRKHGHPTIWFNAWHHQKEESLLAALLQTLRLEGVSPVWSLDGARFRFRLLLRRWKRNRLLILAAAVVVILFGVFERDHVNAKGHNFFSDGVEPVWNAFQGKPEPAAANASENGKGAPSPAAPNPNLPDSVGKYPWLSQLLVTATLIGGLWRGAKTFGADPAALLATLSRGNSIQNLEAQTSFRHRFAVEFCDVTSALAGRNRLNVFIDDLDRCRPENVTELLEAVNFLTSSGECFVIMGIAREQVELAVGLNFKEMAQEMGDDPSEAAGRKNRRGYARQYLDKLIHIEVSVPAPTPSQMEDLFLPSTASGPLASQKRARFWKSLAVNVLPVAIAVALGVGVYKLVPGAGSEPPATQTSATPSKDTAPGRARPNAPTSNPPASAPAPEIVAGESPRPKGGGVSWIFSLTLAGLLGAAYLALTRKPEPLVKDSPLFSEALKIWHPLVMAVHGTPRTARRFMNRVRYLAMRQQAQLHRAAGDTIPEPALVALTAMYAGDPISWTGNVPVYAVPDDLEKSAGERAQARAQAAFAEAQKKHHEKFGNWEQVAGYRERFLELQPEITTR